MIVQTEQDIYCSQLSSVSVKSCSCSATLHLLFAYRLSSVPTTRSLTKMVTKQTCDRERETVKIIGCFCLIQIKFLYTHTSIITLAYISVRHTKFGCRCAHWSENYFFIYRICKQSLAEVLAKKTGCFIRFRTYNFYQSEVLVQYYLLLPFQVVLK